MEDLDSLLLNEAFALPPEMLHENTLNSEILATRCVGLSLEDAEVLGFNISVPEPDLEPQSAPKPEVAASAVGDDEMDIDDDNEVGSPLNRLCTFPLTSQNSFVYTTRIQTQPHQALSTTMSSPCDYEVRTPLSTLPGSPVAARWVHIEKNEGGGQAEGVSTHSSKGKGKGSGQCEGDGHQGTCVCTHSPNVLGVCLGPLVGVDATPEGEGQPEPQPEVIAEAEAEAQRVGEVTAEVMAEAAAEVVVTSVESVAGDETTPAPTAEESVPTAPTFGDTSSSFKSVSEVVDPETHETHTSAQPGGPDAAVHTGTTATAVHTGATHTPPTSRAAAPVAAAHTTPPTNPVFKILAATDLNAPPSSGVHTPSCHLKEQADHLQSESEGRPLSDAATTSEAFVLYNEDPELLEMLVPPVIIAQPIIVTKGVSSPPSSPLTPVTGVPWVIIGQPVFVPCINKEGVTAIFHGDPIVINDHDDDDMSSSPPSSQPSSPLSNITDMDLEESQPAPIPTARLTATLALGSSTPPSFRKSPRKASPPPSQYAVGKTSPSPQLDDAMAVEDMIDIDHSEPTPVLTPANEAPDQASEASRQMSELPSVEEESPKAPEFTR
jgi:hypothetical protein